MKEEESKIFEKMNEHHINELRDIIKKNVSDFKTKLKKYHGLNAEKIMRDHKMANLIGSDLHQASIDSSGNDLDSGLKTVIYDGVKIKVKDQKIFENDSLAKIPQFEFGDNETNLKHLDELIKHPNFKKL